MKKWYVLPALFLIVTSFAFSPFAFAGKDTYYVYVDDLPSWADNAGNAAFTATEFWMDNNDWLNFYKASSPATADIHIQWVKEFGTETVGHVIDKWFVEVGLGDSVCYEHWQPFSANYVNYITTHEIGHVLGLQHTDDPDSIMYPIANNLEYGVVEQEFTLTDNYAQFVGLCTIKDVTTLNYWVSSDDPTYGFDVYVVPSIDSLDDWGDGKSFKYYSNEGCFEKNFISFGGTCTGVSQGSGLLIIMNSELTNPLTKLTVEMQELTTSSLSKASVTLEQPSFEVEEQPSFEVEERPTFLDIFDSQDTDSDGIIDSIDKCRLSPETFNGYLDTDGCPDSIPKPRVPDFVDPQKGAQYYIDRYNNEIEYRQWFHRNYPDYSITEAIEIAIPDAFSKNEVKPRVPDFVDPNKGTQYYLNRYNNEPVYKAWFDKNYPDYTIEEAIEIAIPDAFSKEPELPEKEKFCFLFWCW